MYTENDISGILLDAGIVVHRTFGPGLLESAYEACLEHELQLRGLRVQRQGTLPITFKGIYVDTGYRYDLLIEGKVIAEIKHVEKLHPRHKMQLLTYLKASGCKLGVLINFNVTRLSDGFQRVVNKL